MVNRVAKFALASASVALAATLAGHAASAQQAVGPNADVQDKNLVLPKNSQLRTGPSLFSRPVAIAPTTLTVKGTGRCDEGACPVSYDGKNLWARRSRLSFGTAEAAAAAAQVPPVAAAGQAAPKPTLAERAKALVTGNKATPPRTRLERGSKGPDVVRLQEALKKANVFNGEVDGNFGRGTRAAVTAYQQANGLKADGVAGRETLAKLGL